jgi:acylphosphatase
MVMRRVQVRVLVSGRPQEVAFRALVSRQAQSWSLLGWVRHLEDGRVEAVFQGPQSSVDAMLSWCRKGPLHAVVEDVAVERQALEAFHGFDVRLE